MALDQPDSLEGWVAVKDNPFTDNMLPPKMVFLVSWNQAEYKIAITCRSGSRVFSDTQDCHSRSGIFSFQELKGIHNLLCLIQPSLQPHLPCLPDEPSGLWSYFNSPPVPEDIDELCRELEAYLSLALDTCKEKLLMSTLFEEPDEERYLQNISELLRQGYEDAVLHSEEEMENAVFERNNCVTMLDMKEAYQAEDDATFRLMVNLAQLYNYLLQPFLDLREVAVGKLKEAKNYLMNPNLGQRVKKEQAVVFSEWQGHYEQALDTIQELYMKYYSYTCDVYEGKGHWHS